MLTGPFLRSLRRAFPETEITFVTRKEFAPLVRNLPHVSQVLELDTTLGKPALRELHKSLQSMEFSHVFDLHNNFRTQFLRKGLSGQLHVYQKRHWKWMALVGLKWNLYSEVVPIPERYIAASNVAEMTPDAQSPELAIPPEATAALPDMVRESTDAPLIAICPGAKHATKRYPLELLLKVVKGLLEQTESRIVILGGKEDAEAGEALAALNSARIFNLCGALSLMESAAALQLASVALSNDSGLMHIATAVGTPITALFGCTVREFGFFPYNAPAAVLEVEGLSCRPCTHIGRKTCPKGHFRCMEDIRPESVVATLLELMHA